MIAFGSAVTDRDVYERCAQPGIELAREADSAVHALPAPGSIFQSYNVLLDWAASQAELEALVLVHQDTEIATPAFCALARQALADESVAIVGCVGAVDVRSIAWWEGSVSLASFVHRFGAPGEGDLPGFSWAWPEAPPYARTGEVDTVDGFLLVLSPWAVRTLRFDESLGAVHGYDFDLCLQARVAGRRVLTADFRAIHHHSLELIGDIGAWVAAHARVAEKWDGRMPGVGWMPGSWEERALRAEAERDAARAEQVTHELVGEARALELERALRETTESLSWRITSPLRLLAGRRRRR